MLITIFDKYVNRFKLYLLLKRMFLSNILISWMTLHGLSTIYQVMRSCFPGKEVSKRKLQRYLTRRSDNILSMSLGFVFRFTFEIVIWIPVVHTFNKKCSLSYISIFPIRLYIEQGPIAIDINYVSFHSVDFSVDKIFSYELCTWLRLKTRNRQNES